MTTPEGGTPPVAPVPPAVTPPAPAAVVPPVEDQNPPWLAGRLARAEKTLLERLGVKDEDEVKTVLAARKAADDAAKTTEQKRIEAEARVKELEEEHGTLLETLGLVAQTKLAGLTEQQRKAVTDLAGDDVNLQLSLIESFAPTWAAQAVTPPPTAAPHAAVTPPASGTAPPPNAPATVVVSPPDRKAEYAALKVKNPHAAALFLNRYHADIYPSAS